MSIRSELLDMYNEKTYKTEIERVACEMFSAIYNVVEVLVEESKGHIDKENALEQIRKEMNVINRI